MGDVLAVVQIKWSLRVHSGLIKIISQRKYLQHTPIKDIVKSTSFKYFFLVFYFNILTQKNTALINVFTNKK